MTDATIQQIAQKALTEGGTHSFTRAADSFGGDRSGQLAPFLRGLTDLGLEVEIRGSTEALQEAHLYPGTAVEGCAIYKSDGGFGDHTLLFKLERSKDKEATPPTTGQR